MELVIFLFHSTRLQPALRLIKKEITLAKARQKEAIISFYPASAGVKIDQKRNNSG
ncbi:MAG: hypothetical protein Q7R92_05415 [bacterium]|nr:hypothetical protein [bacterium]